MADPVELSRRIKRMILSASGIEIEKVWLEKIMHNQSNEEILSGVTNENNGIGLNAKDAPIVTSMYRQVMCGYSLSVAQVSTLKKILPKYWRQFGKMMCHGDSV